MAIEIPVSLPVDDTMKVTHDPGSRRVLKADAAILLASLLWGGGI